MFYEKKDLYEYFGIARKGGDGGYITLYSRTTPDRLRKRTRPAMLVVPGGGYGHLSTREGEPVALEFMNAGYCAFLLGYSIHTAYPIPLIEACMAVAYIRENANKYGVDAKHVGAIGFSAGGHLTGLLATADRDNAVETALGKRAKLTRPDAVVLSYPVVTLGELTHKDTRDVITGGDKALRDALSVEKRVGKNTAPAFIWHTAADELVPVDNSLMLAAAYRAAGVPCELHVFERGRHGLSLANGETGDDTADDAELCRVGAWVGLALDWLRSRGFTVDIGR